MRPMRFLCAALAVILWVTICAPTGAQAVGMVQVSDPRGRFTIGFPENWEVVTPENGLTPVMAAAPRSADSFRTNVNVAVETLSEPMDPESYAALGVRLLRTVFHGFTIVDQGPATIGGRPAFYRYCTWETNTGFVVYQVQAYFTVGRQGFVVTGSTLNDANHIRRDIPVIAQIFETFHPITKAPAPGE